LFGRELGSGGRCESVYRMWEMYLLVVLGSGEDGRVGVE